MRYGRHQSATSLWWDRARLPQRLARQSPFLSGASVSLAGASACHVPAMQGASVKVGRQGEAGVGTRWNSWAG